MGVGLAVGAGITALGTVAAAGVNQGWFGGGGGSSTGVGGAGSIDSAAMMKLLKKYQEMVDSGIGEYQSNLGSAKSSFQSAVDSSLNDYTGGMTSALKQFGKRQNNATRSYLKNTNRLTADPMGQYVLPAAQQALQFNLDNTGTFGNLARNLTLEDQKTRFAELDAAIPTWKQDRDKAARINESLMSGQIPMDAQQQVARSAAFKSLQGGFGSDSGMGRSLVARDFGKTSLDLQQLGQQNTQGWDQLLYNIAVPQQTTAADIMQFNGISGNTAANAGLASMAARVGVQGNVFQGRLGTNSTVLNTAGNTLGNVLSTQFNTSRDIFGADTTAARDIFGARTGVAENSTNFGSGLLTRQADDAQAAANFAAQQNAQTANTISAGVGALGGTLADYYKNKTSPSTGGQVGWTTSSGSGWKTTNGNYWNPNV